MAFITITARFAGVCKRCGGAIQPGQRIRWMKGRKGMTYHLQAQCGNPELAHDDPGYLKGGNYQDNPCPRRRSHDDIAREGGYEDTMGVSPDALEAWRNGGDYNDEPPDVDF
jgi:hypothetical protein